MQRHSQVEKRSSIYFQSVTILYLLVWSQVYISDRKQSSHVFIRILQKSSTSSIWKNSALVLELAMYEYVLHFHQMAQHDNADALSRLPLPGTIDTVPLPGETYPPYWPPNWRTKYSSSAENLESLRSSFDKSILLYQKWLS